MFNLTSSLHSGSVPWDTNYARKYLKISQDELEKINKIPGWSKAEIPENTATENEKTSEDNEKQSAQQALTIKANILSAGTHISSEDSNYFKNNCNSNLQSKQTYASNAMDEKELFLKNVSLSELRKKQAPSFSLQRSSSLPDLSGEILPYDNSEEIFRKRINSLEKDISSFKLAPHVTKNISKKTNLAPGISNDGVDNNKLLDISHKSFSCLLENPNQMLKQKFKSLDDSILSHRYLKDTDTSIITSETFPLSSNETVQSTLKKEKSLFQKKLLLLEKRFSPSKEMIPPPFNAKLINLKNLNREKDLKSPERPISAEVKAVANSDLVEDLTDEIENPCMSKSCKFLESQTNSQPRIEKSGALKDTLESARNRTDDSSKTAACNFESFISPPLPCGQPVPAEVVSSQSNSLQKSAELNTPYKSHNTSPVTSGQPTEVLSPSQPIQSQKSALLNTSSKSQNAELSGKIMAPEKPSGTFSVFSANLNEKVSDVAVDKELGIKRKRRTKSEKSSKKLDVKKLKRTDIQFSSTQIKSMIEIMKIFHTEF